jgi:dihydrofolate reductase
MGKIKVHEFITLDSVITVPSWTAGFGFDPQMGEAIGALMSTCTAILLGRTTYEMFYPAWSSRTEAEDPGAPFFNGTVKYVVSGTLTEASWQNSEILGTYDPAVIKKLKEKGDMYVSGSGTLVRALLADGLVDELHLFTYPLTLGTGARLFADGDQPATFGLAAAQTYENGVQYACYTPAAG